MSVKQIGTSESAGRENMAEMRNLGVDVRNLDIVTKVDKETVEMIKWKSNAFCPSAICLTGVNEKNVDDGNPLIICQAVDDEKKINGDSFPVTCQVDDDEIRSAGDSSPVICQADNDEIRTTGDSSLVICQANDDEKKTAGDSSLVICQADDEEMRSAGNSFSVTYQVDDDEIRTAGDSSPVIYQDDKEKKTAGDSSPVIYQAHDDEIKTAGDSFPLICQVHDNEIKTAGDSFPVICQAHDNEIKTAGDSFPVICQAHDDEIKTAGDSFPVICQTDDDEKKTNGDCSSVICQAHDDEIKTAGDSFPVICQAHDDEIKTAGDSFPVICQTDDDEKKTNGDCSSVICQADEDEKKTAGDKYPVICQTNDDGKKTDNSNFSIISQSDDDGKKICVENSSIVCQEGRQIVDDAKFFNIHQAGDDRKSSGVENASIICPIDLDGQNTDDVNPSAICLTVEDGKKAVDYNSSNLPVSNVLSRKKTGGDKYSIICQAEDDGNKTDDNKCSVICQTDDDRKKNDHDNSSGISSSVTVKISTADDSSSDALLRDDDGKKTYNTTSFDASFSGIMRERKFDGCGISTVISQTDADAEENYCEISLGPPHGEDSGKTTDDDSFSASSVIDVVRKKTEDGNSSDICQMDIDGNKTDTKNNDHEADTVKSLDICLSRNCRKITDDDSSQIAFRADWNRQEANVDNSSLISLVIKPREQTGMDSVAAKDHPSEETNKIEDNTTLASHQSYLNPILASHQSYLKRKETAGDTQQFQPDAQREKNAAADDIAQVSSHIRAGGDTYLPTYQSNCEEKPSDTYTDQETDSDLPNAALEMAISHQQGLRNRVNSSSAPEEVQVPVGESRTSATEENETHQMGQEDLDESDRDQNWWERFTLIIFVIAVIFLAAALILVFVACPSPTKMVAEMIINKPVPPPHGNFISAQKAFSLATVKKKGSETSYLGLSVLTFDPDFNDPETEHVYGITVRKDSFIIDKPGVYCVYLQLQIDVNTTVPRETKIQANVYRKRFIDQAMRIRLILQAVPTMQLGFLAKESLHESTEQVFQAGDILEVQGPGPDIVDFSKESSFFGLYQIPENVLNRTFVLLG